MRRVAEVIVVEGRYDKNAVLQVVDATVIETSGFGILNDKDKLALLGKLAEKRGLIILTDSDSAGFFIRGRLRGALANTRVKHAYIPDVEGREKRKASYSKEGKIGVEGMRPEVILAALERAGATFEAESGGEITQSTTGEAGRSSGEDACVIAEGLNKEDAGDGNSPANSLQRITKTDMVVCGLSGGEGSAQKRRQLLIRLGLPERMSANSLLEVLNILYTREEFLALF